DQVQDIINIGHAPADSSESAIIANLSPGNYTAIVRGAMPTPAPTPTPIPTATTTPTPTATGTPTPTATPLEGVALVEVYDLSPNLHSILGNISTRSLVQTGDDAMIGGFIVQGTQPKNVIIRAIGPELSQYGVPDFVADPTLELHDGTGALIASNDE